MKVLVERHLVDAGAIDRGIGDELSLLAVGVGERSLDAAVGYVVEYEFVVAAGRGKRGALALGGRRLRVDVPAEPDRLALGLSLAVADVGTHGADALVVGWVHLDRDGGQVVGPGQPAEVDREVARARLLAAAVGALAAGVAVVITPAGCHQPSRKGCGQSQDQDPPLALHRSSSVTAGMLVLASPVVWEVSIGPLSCGGADGMKLVQARVSE